MTQATIDKTAFAQKVFGPSFLIGDPGQLISHGPERAGDREPWTRARIHRYDR